MIVEKGVPQDTYPPPGHDSAPLKSKCAAGEGNPKGTGGLPDEENCGEEDDDEDIYTTWVAIILLSQSSCMIAWVALPYWEVTQKQILFARVKLGDGNHWCVRLVSINT